MTTYSLQVAVFNMALLSALLAAAAIAEELAPQIKKSNARICYEPGSSLYDELKIFTGFNSMQDCIKSGGRPATGSARATPTSAPQSSEGGAAKVENAEPRAPQQL